MSILTETNLSLPLLTTGKVRSLYEIPDSKYLLFVATDRVSSFDVVGLDGNPVTVFMRVGHLMSLYGRGLLSLSLVLKNGIPNKGRVLTLMSVFWFSFLKEHLPSIQTHFITLDLPLSIGSDDARLYRQRSMQVRRLEVLPLESIVRGYITGSAFSEYQKHGTVHGLQMPKGLRESEKLEKAIWTPSTKAEQGEKDENISPTQAAEIVGADIAKRVEELSLQIYNKAAEYALQRGIIIADTKFEFAIDRINDSIVLIDEVLTPDSSRFWRVSKYEAGRAQESLDKQVLRNWLIENGLKGKADVEMPPDVVQKTADSYRESFEALTGQSWLDATKD